MTRILTVEDVFDIPSFGGLVVVPGPLMADEPSRPEGPVILRRPDGSQLPASLKMQQIFQTPPPKERRWACILSNVEKSEVPVGTEIWSDISNDLTALLDLFVSGDDNSIDEANRLEVLLDEAYPDDEIVQSRVADLALYRPGGGEFLIDTSEMRARLTRLRDYLRKIEEGPIHG
jgi:hypothetical protein